MTVYIDSLRHQGWRLRGRPTPSCHMWADSLDELLEFASRIGLRREWLQRSWPHFDLSRGMRHRALEAGAVEVSIRAASVAARVGRLSAESAKHAVPRRDRDELRFRRVNEEGGQHAQQQT